MPPRRSTRAKVPVASRTATPEPPSAASRNASTKRKRVIVDEDEEGDAEQQLEEADVPQGLKGKGKALSSQQGARSGAGKASRKTSNETEMVTDDSDRQPSPPKRSRKHLPKEQSVDEDDGEQNPKSRGGSTRLRKAAQAKPLKPSAKPSESYTTDEDEVEESNAEDEEYQAEERKGKSKGRRPASKPQSRAHGSTRPSKVAKQVDPEATDEEESDNVLEESAMKGRRTISKNAVGSKNTETPSSRRSLPTSRNPGKKGQASSSPQTKDMPTPRSNKSSSVEMGSGSGAGAQLSESSETLEDEPEKSLLEPSIAPIPKYAPVVQEEPQGPKSRLVIHKMALIDFKSYAGRQEIGPFHKSFSAIVGPNGSGKSNTIDALLFVFGYRASKMRQAKLSELIHNSAKYPDLDECSVEVHFREILDLPGPDAFEVIPNSQLVVARTAYKSNASKYTINGRASNYTEVQTLLKGRGIDLDHKRFLILQGEVESIAQMKPKAPTEHEDGLLEYLEDIIGTSKYKTPIDEALAELDRFAEDRTEKLNRLRIVEREKDALESKKQEAEDFLRLQNEHVRALSRLYQWYLGKCFAADQVFAETIESLERDLAKETEKNKDDITHCQLLEEHYQKRGKVYDEVKAAAAEAVKDLAVHEKQQVGLEERKKHAKSKDKKLKKSLQEDGHAKAEALRFIESNAEKMVKEKAKLTEHEASLEKEEKVLEGIRDSLKDKTQVFHDQIEVKQKELQPWTAKINIRQSDIDVAVSERDTLAKKVEAIKTQRKEAQEALAQLQADHKAKATELQTLKSSKITLQKGIEAGEKKLQDMQKRVEDLRTKASTARQKADEAKASQAASTSQNKVLESLTRLRNTGRITGFHGRLGSLGTIAEKYDVAISTACPSLHNLIVDTVDQGQACIEYLRKQNIGRASFIVLDKLSSTNGLEKVATPENVPRLFDLIQPKDPRFAPAFFKAVGNTLVANDLEQANRIAFGAQKRWRVVTLTGQLIDTSGTMSGGGTHLARGAMSSKLAAEAVQPEVLRQYEKEGEDASRELEAALSDLRTYEAELDALSKNAPAVEMSLHKVELDIQTGTKRIAQADNRVRELKSQSKPDEGDLARISILENEIEASTEELEELKKKASVVEKAIHDLEKKILDIGGSKLLTQKSKVDGIRLHINIALEEITKAEVNKAKAESDASKLEKTIESSTAALNEVQAEIEELNEQLEECNGFVTKLQSKVDAAQAAADNAKDDLDNLKAELDEKTEQIQQFRNKEMEIKQRLDDAKKESKENEKTIDHYRAEHDKLKLEDIDDDEDEDEQDGASTTQGDTDSATVKPEPSEDAMPDVNTRRRSPSAELYVYTIEELSRFKKKELLADVTLLEEQVKNANPNLGVLKEYRKREQEYLKRAKDLEHVTNLRDGQKQKYDGLRKQRLDEFMTGFSMISTKLKEMYQMITLGGNAELELVDSMDPFSEGIIFSVMPPKKSWKNISNLSGGEKTLSSLALVFALHVFKPTPLYFMDEIDAALDFRNVSIVANYIKDRTKNAQFIIISLRNDMFELSHRLIGIYKTSNATRSVSINNHALKALSVNAVRA